VSFGVYPCARTAAAAALAPAALGSCFVNAGSGAERVVVVPVLVGLVVAPLDDGVVPVAELVVFALGVGVVAVVCETGGTLDAVTVFVPEPHAASSADAHTAIAATERAFTRIRRIDPSYSPFGAALLA
jgi:hypothetical protein